MGSDFSELLKNSGAQEIIARYRQAGFETRFIGGCVRDVLCGRPVNDIDLATTAVPQQGISLFAATDIKAIPTGIDHGTITLRHNGLNYEVTTLRRDIATDGRHAEVAYTNDWQEDAARRDFTVNALSVDSAGQLHDYFSGLADIKAKKLRFIGSAVQRLSEDYLRLLRYFRFASQLDWSIDQDTETLQACREALSGLKQISRERIRVEFEKMMVGPAVLRTLKTIDQQGLSLAFLGQEFNIKKFSDLLVHEKENGQMDSFRRLWCLCGAHIDQVILLSRKEKKRITDVIDLSENKNWSLQKKIYYKGPQAVEDWGYLTGNFDILPLPLLPPFPVRAVDLDHALSGPAVGATLRELEEKWLTADCRLGKEELLKGL